MEVLTPEAAKTVPLSLNPIRRLGQLAEHGSALHIRNDGWSPLGLYMTRRGLVRAAEIHQRIESLVRPALQQAELSAVTEGN